MDFEDFLKNIKELLIKLDIEINDTKAQMLYKYMNILLKWNENINLTAITEPKEIVIKHFADSLTIMKHIQNVENVLDIGTGAGFPGIPLSILNENINFVLADSLNKRIKFLEEVKSELNLSNVKLIHSRAEELAKNKEHREQYNAVVSRAVARLNVLSEYMLPFVKLDGICICMKADNCDEEVNEAKKAIEVLGGKIEKIDEILLPGTEIVRKNIIIKKEKNTPERYPRKPGTPLKEPIA